MRTSDYSYWLVVSLSVIVSSNKPAEEAIYQSITLVFAWNLKVPLLACSYCDSKQLIWGSVTTASCLLLAGGYGYSVFANGVACAPNANTFI